MFRHQKADFLFGRRAGIYDAADPSAAENQDPVRKLQKYIKIFSDIDDGNTFLFLFI
jgi:hypothetical protein